MEKWKPLNLGVSYGACFAPDGGTLAVVGKSVSVWNALERRKLFRVHPFSHPSHVAFAPSGRYLAVKNTSGRIATIDAATGTILRDFANQTEGEGCGVAISADSSLIIDGSWKGQLTARDARTGAIKFRNDQPGTMILNLAWLEPRHTWLVHRGFVSPSGDGRPDIFEFWAATFGDAPQSIWTTHLRHNTRWALSSDASRLALVTGAPPRDLRVFDMSTLREITKATLTTSGSQNGLCWIGSDRLFVPEKGQFTLLAIEQDRVEELAIVAADYPATVAASPASDFIALAAWDGGRVIRLSDLEAGPGGSRKRR